MALSLSGDGTLSGVDIAASGLGKVLQVVRATDTTARSTSSTSFVDANISVTITPQKSDSAILLIHSCRALAANADVIQMQITDSSNNAISGAEAMAQGSSATGHQGPNILIGYATPATTSAVTYKVRFSQSGGAGSSTIRNNLTTGQLFALEISA